MHQESTYVYMTPDDFLRAITPGVKQPEVKYFIEMVMEF